MTAFRDSVPNPGGHAIGRRLFLGGAATLAASGRLRADAAGDAVRETRQGLVRGIVSGGVSTFRGIPYARPPVGALRFRPPEPPAPWTGVREAMRFAPIAPQVTPGTSASLAGMSEDCLYLNIYAPAAPGPHPVLVWVHGGGNSNGSPTVAADGAVFARRGIVCVTIAYRLGAFGFLELGELLGPRYAGSGTNALRDQIAALRWVRDNIAGFGGDPSRVTLGGVSAGAKNVVSLCASPPARGLFGAAIVESGGITSFDLAEARGIARRLAAALPSGSRIADLPTVEPAIILAAQGALMAGSDRPFPFRAITETDVLPVPVLDMLRRGRGPRRLLIGTNSDESILFIDRASAARPIEQRDLANVDVARARAVADGYDRLFPDLDALHRRVRLVTAEEYGLPSIRIADAVRAGGGRVHVYRFAQAARTGPFAGWAGHGFEVPYIWQSFADPMLAAIVGMPDAGMLSLAYEMTERWCAFIRGHDPDVDRAVGWPIYDGLRIMRLEAPKGRVDVKDIAEIALWG